MPTWTLHGRGRMNRVARDTIELALYVDIPP